MVIKDSSLFCRYSLNMKIKIVNSRDSSDVEPWMPRVPRGIQDGCRRILSIGVTVKNYIVSDLRDIKCPVHFSLIVTGDRKCSWIMYTNQTANKIRAGKRVDTAC